MTTKDKAQIMERLWTELSQPGFGIDSLLIYAGNYPIMFEKYRCMFSGFFPLQYTNRLRIITFLFMWFPIADKLLFEFSTASEKALWTQKFGFADAG